MVVVVVVGVVDQERSSGYRRVQRRTGKLFCDSQGIPWEQLCRHFGLLSSTMSRVDDSPGWPSLYNPGLELYPLENRDPEQPGGVYLHHYSDVFRFTLYWTIVLCVPIYFLCATLAFCNVVAPGKKQRDYGEAWEMQLLGHSQRPRKTNERRSRLTFALLVVFIFLAMSLLGALIGSTITSLILLGMFRSGGYSMST